MFGVWCLVFDVWLGCIGGGGQPKVKDPNTLFKRMQAIYSLDEKATIRRSHENPSIQQLYREFLEHPLGHKSHHLLHTHYENRTSAYPCMPPKTPFSTSVGNQHQPSSKSAATTPHTPASSSNWFISEESDSFWSAILWFLLNLNIDTCSAALNL